MLSVVEEKGDRLESTTGVLEPILTTWRWLGKLRHPTSPSIVTPPSQIDAALDKCYHQSLSCLWVNRNIKKELCTLPLMYQGLRMFSLGVDSTFFGSRLLFLRQHWQSESAVGRLLQQAFECFQMDIGLDCNIFNRPSVLSFLVQIVAGFCDYYSVGFSLELCR